MKVIAPITIGDAQLYSSSVAETEYAAWSSITDYAVAARVIVAHVIYESVQTPNVNHAPATEPLYWTAIGPSNRWAMFDNEVSTVTSAASAITVALLPGNVNALALIGVVGSEATVTVRDSTGGAIVYQRTESLDGAIITDWYEYFFEPTSPRTEVAFLGLPPYTAGEITVAITASGTTVAVAHLAVGTAYDLGDSLNGGSVGIIDYSRKDVSPTGVITLQVRKFSSRLSLQTVLQRVLLAKARAVLSSLRATPCVWIAGSTQSADALLIFGFYRDFSIDIAYSQHVLCNLEIEGMT